MQPVAAFDKELIDNQWPSVIGMYAGSSSNSHW